MRTLIRMQAQPIPLPTPQPTAQPQLTRRATLLIQQATPQIAQTQRTPLILLTQLILQVRIRVVLPTQLPQIQLEVEDFKASFIRKVESYKPLIPQLLEPPYMMETSLGFRSQ